MDDLFTWVGDQLFIRVEIKTENIMHDVNIDIKDSTPGQRSILYNKLYKGQITRIFEHYLKIQIKKEAKI